MQNEILKKNERKINGVKLVTFTKYQQHLLMEKNYKLLVLVTQMMKLLHEMHIPGNTKGGSITVPLTSCLTGLESAALQLTFFCKTD